MGVCIDNTVCVYMSVVMVVMNDVSTSLEKMSQTHLSLGTNSC